MKDNMTISLLTNPSHTDFADLAGLLGQLDGQVLTVSALDSVLVDPDVILYVAREGGRIVGCAELVVFRTLSGLMGRVEDVVVSDEHRGQGIGRQLVEHVIDQARLLEIGQLQLTSQPKRVAANALYRKLGFVLKETNCYKLDL